MIFAAPKEEEGGGSAGGGPPRKQARAAAPRGPDLRPTADAAAWAALADAYSALGVDDMAACVSLHHVAACPGTRKGLRALQRREMEAAYDAFDGLMRVRWVGVEGWGLMAGDGFMVGVQPPRQTASVWVCACLEEGTSRA